MPSRIEVEVVADHILDHQLWKVVIHNLGDQDECIGMYGGVLQVLRPGDQFVVPTPEIA